MTEAPGTEAPGTEAPGTEHPGLRHRAGRVWCRAGTSSAKSGIGIALSPTSRAWFTISHGILNEVCFPRVDAACVRDFGLMVSDGDAFFAEEKRDRGFVVETVEDGVPAFALTNTHRGGRFRIVKRIISDPRNDVVLQHVKLQDLSGHGLQLFALVALHLVNGGAHNRG